MFIIEVFHCLCSDIPAQTALHLTESYSNPLKELYTKFSSLEFSLQLPFYLPGWPHDHVDAYKSPTEPLVPYLCQHCVSKQEIATNRQSLMLTITYPAKVVAYTVINKTIQNKHQEGHLIVCNIMYLLRHLILSTKWWLWRCILLYSMDLGCAGRQFVLVFMQHNTATFSGEMVLYLAPLSINDTKMQKCSHVKCSDWNSSH